MEDPRKTGLKNGLRQLTNEEIQRVLDYPGEMVLDTYNYHDGKFCPLAIAVDLPNMRPFIKSGFIENFEWTNEKVIDVLEIMGFNVFNTRGIEGSFYTKNRKEDLLIAAKEVLEERNAGTSPAAKYEPNPVGDGVAIWPLIVDDFRDPWFCIDWESNKIRQQLLLDIEQRKDLGKEKYGTLLRTNNGRDALVDLYQEELDAVAYARQKLEEIDIGDVDFYCDVEEIYISMLEAAAKTRKILNDR